MRMITEPPVRECCHIIHISDLARPTQMRTPIESMREKERSLIPLERRIATFTSLRTIAGMIAIVFFANVGMLEAQTTVVASDNFQRPNGPLGTNWATPLAGLAPYSFGNLVITNDVVGVNSNDYHCYAYGATNTFSDNQYSQAIITSIGPWTGVIVRADTNQDMFYLSLVFGPNDYRIYARYNGVYYELATGSAVTWHVGDTLKLEVSGPVNQVTLSMYQNGAPVLMWRSTLSAQVFTGGSPGIGIYSPSGDNLTIGSWKGGNLNPDTNAPTVPANLAATAVTGPQINLSWTSATDNVGVVGYLVERSQGEGSTNFFLLDSPTGTNYSDAESTTLYTIYTTNSAVLLPGTTYNYLVMAIDAAGNVSRPGRVVTATTPIPPLPTITVIPNQTTLAGISVGPFPFYISDPGVNPALLTATATSSNTNLVPNENLFVYYYNGPQSLTITPADGQSGTSLITLNASNGFNSTNTTFLLTVKAPGTGNNVFANPTNIVIPSLGKTTPYPLTISVSGEVGTITNVVVTLHGMNHTFPGDVNMLLVGPGGQAVVLMSHAVGPFPMTNITFTLSDQASYPLPINSPMAFGTFQPTDNAPDHTNSAWAFPEPAPAPPFSTTLGTFDGLSPNGTWSLYISDGAADGGGQITGGWSLAITTVSPLTITSIRLTSLMNALLTGTGSASLAYTIQASTNLINWTQIGTATAGTNGVFTFKDTQINNFKKRFYRVVLP